MNANEGDPEVPQTTKCVCVHVCVYYESEEENQDANIWTDGKNVNGISVSPTNRLTQEKQDVKAQTSQVNRKNYKPAAVV